MISNGDIWLVDFGEPFPSEPAYTRPALVLGPPRNFSPQFPVVIVAPLTTTRRQMSLHVELEASARSGLSRTSYVQPEGMRSVSKTRLVRRMGAVDLAGMRAVQASLALLLGLAVREF